MPERIQRKRSRDWRMPENTVYVGRPTCWGNPFCSPSMTAKQKMKSYESWIRTMPILLSDIQQLAGKNLACWCKPGEPCHADVILRLANHGL